MQLLNFSGFLVNSLCRDVLLGNSARSPECIARVLESYSSSKLRVECTGDQLWVTAEAAVPLLLTAAGSGERGREGPPGPQSTSAGGGESCCYFLVQKSFTVFFVFIAVDFSSSTHNRGTT